MLESLSYYKFIEAALILIILYVVLRKILFKPVTEFMDNRSKAIQDDIDGAHAAKEEAMQLKAAYDEQLKSAMLEGEKIVSEAVAQANQERERIVDEARREAEQLMETTRMKLEHEQVQMLRDIRSQVAGLALAAASKVLEANMDTEQNKALVDRFIDEAGVA